MNFAMCTCPTKIAGNSTLPKHGRSERWCCFLFWGDVSYIIWQTTATTLPCPPAVYPHDNTWSIFAQKDITVEFVHVLTGAHGGKQWKVRIKTFQNGATKLQNQWTPPGVHRLGADLLDVFLTCLNSFSRSAGLYDLGPAKSLTAERVIITIWRIDK